MTKTEVKLRCVVAIIWGLIVMFAMTGVVLGRTEGAFVAIIAAVMWTQLRIIQEGIEAVKLLKALKNDVDANVDDSQT